MTIRLTIQWWLKALPSSTSTSAHPSLQLRIGHDMQYLPHRSFEFAMRSVNEVGRMIGGWSKEQEGA